MPPKKLNEYITDVSGVTLSNEQQKLFEIIEKTSDHIFITGKAGTGKSLLLQYFRTHSQKNVVVCAPTGVAALNVGGQTIHSLLKIPPIFIRKGSVRLDKRTTAILKKVDTIVIDEISMVRADLMDAIDEACRKARSSEESFGGIQIVMFGDLYQLPPVVSDPELHRHFAENYGGYYFFNADCWRESELSIYELNQVFRQSDESFKNVLNSIRVGEVDDNILETINSRFGAEFPTDRIIVLATTNATADQINNYELSLLPDDPLEYKASITGDLEYSTFPTDQILKLKPRAQVMFLRNDPSHRWVNGTVGVVHSLAAKEIKVDVDGTIYNVTPETWNKIKYFYNQSTDSIEEEVVSSFTQFPLRLAWALTVHKSQGRTYSSVIIDMGKGAFATGQAYVALSRCQTLQGIYLKRPLSFRDIMVDESVVNFMRGARIVEL